MHGNTVSLIYRQAEGRQRKKQTNKQTKRKEGHVQRAGDRRTEDWSPDGLESDWSRTRVGLESD